MGYESCVDKAKLDKDTLEENWAKVVNDESFNHKRLNELFGMTKGRRIDQDMKPRQVLMWINQLLLSFGLAVKYDHGKYRLVEKVALLELIKRKNKQGKYYIDGDNLLGQVKEDDEDLFIDESNGAIKSTKQQKRTDKLLAQLAMIDIGVNMD